MRKLNPKLSSPKWEQKLLHFFFFTFVFLTISSVNNTNHNSNSGNCVAAQDIGERMIGWFSSFWTNLFPVRNDRTIENRVETVLMSFSNSNSSSQTNLNATLGVLLPNRSSFNRSLSQVAWCYDPVIPGGERTPVNIFNEALHFRTIATKYYKAFASKVISHRSLSALFESTTELINRCTEGNYRREGVRFGFTALSDMPHDAIRQMLGAIEPTQNQQSSTLSKRRRRRKRLTGSSAECQPDYGRSVPSTFDWRREGAVTPVRSQGLCASDWMFATVSAIESSLLVNQKTLQTNKTLNLSEQQLLDCVRSDGCTSGGNSRHGFGYVKNYGLSEESIVPYVAKVQPCPYSKLDYYYPIRDYCIRSRFAYSRDAHVEHLSDLDIQRTLVQYGPLYVLVDSNPEIFQNYRDGVISDPQCTDGVNHSALLVGYTRDAWIVKNSFGVGWGDEGYFRLRRGHNLCGVNSEIAWALL